MLLHTPQIGRTVLTTTITPKRMLDDMTVDTISNMTTSRLHPKFKAVRQITTYSMSRSKRGLLDIGGTLLSAVFGVSTEGELRDARKELQGEITEVDHVSEVIQVQALKAEARMTDALSPIKLQQSHYFQSDCVKID